MMTTLNNVHANSSLPPTCNLFEGELTAQCQSKDACQVSLSIVLSTHIISSGLQRWVTLGGLISVHSSTLQSQVQVAVLL